MPLNGSNYKTWRTELDLNLAQQNADWCLSVPMPTELGAARDNWLRANKICKLTIIRTMTDVVKGGIPEKEVASEFLEAIAERFAVSDKAETSMLLDQLHSMKYDMKLNIREYILKMIDIASKLTALKMTIEEDLVVMLVLKSLPVEFDQLKTAYNTQKDKWSLNELIAVCVQEHERIKRVTIHLVTTKPQWNKAEKKTGPSKNLGVGKKAMKVSGNKGGIKCFFCKVKGHMKRDCGKYKTWKAKRGNEPVINFYVEVNLVNVHTDTWSFDTGSPVHITNSLQGLQSLRRPRENEVRIHVGEGTRVEIEAVGFVKLVLRPGVFLVLEQVYYVPSMSRNLISVAVLVKDNCQFLIDSYGMKISRASHYLATAQFIDDYWSLPNTCHTEVLLIENGVDDSITGNKRKMNEKSAFLWHRRLGHVSKERLKLLIKQGILPNLDFSDLVDCIECVKGKFAKQSKKKASRSTTLLDLVHTDICGPFAVQTICGNKYYITFIDDFSRYCHVYLIAEKSQALEKFKIFKLEAEKELNAVVKCVRSDRGGEYYGRYTETGQHKGPFALFLEENGIIAQYTAPGTPEQNGVAERRNRTFMNMVRSMMCTSGLPHFLWGEALKTANYLSNRTPSKSVSATKTPFELWKNRKPSIYHTHVWGCKAEARPYNPKESKLDSKTVSASFIGYCEHSKGFRFYCPSHSQRIIETNKAVFFNEINHSHSFEDFDFEEISEHAPTSVVTSPSIQAVILETRPAVFSGIDASAFAPNLPATGTDASAPVPNFPENGIAAPVPNPPPPPPIRRSQREKRSRLQTLAADFQVYEVEVDYDAGEIEDPKTFQQAISGDHSHEWEKAMISEMKSMHVNDVWELVEPSKSQKAIGCKWLYKTKLNADGSIERYKARLVAKGFTQKEGVDYAETFSPVSTKDAFRAIMAMVAHYDMELHQMDVKTAFLNGELSEEIFMKQPEGFIEPGNEHLVCKLNRSIYGLKQASRQWYLKFDSVISCFGFKENQVDNCVYMKSEGKNFIFLILYVDDILLASTNLDLLEQTKSFLSKKFDMKDLGEAKYVLGIEIKRDRSRFLLGLSQQSYINTVLKRFDMQDCTAGAVPMSKGDKLHKNQCPRNNLQREQMLNKPYAELIGSLMYAQVCTRPDLSYAVGILSRFQSNPGIEHWTAGKKILRYLQGTKNHFLVYRRVKQLEVVGFTDADFASSYPHSNKSTTGYVFTLAGGAIAWKTVKQTLIATSTMQAEYIAIYEGACEGLWLKNFLVQTNAVDSILSIPMKIYCDNSAAVFFSKNNKRSTNSKHINLKYYSVRENVKHKELDVLKIGTVEQLADPFTKPMTVAAFEKHAADIGILPTLD